MAGRFSCPLRGQRLRLTELLTPTFNHMIFARSLHDMIFVERLHNVILAGRLHDMIFARRLHNSNNFIAVSWIPRSAIIM